MIARALETQMRGDHQASGDTRVTNKPNASNPVMTLVVLFLLLYTLTVDSYAVPNPAFDQVFHGDPYMPPAYGVVDDEWRADVFPGTIRRGRTVVLPLSGDSLNCPRSSILAYSGYGYDQTLQWCQLSNMWEYCPEKGPLGEWRHRGGDRTHTYIPLGTAWNEVDFGHKMHRNESDPTNYYEINQPPGRRGSFMERSVGTQVVIIGGYGYWLDGVATSYGRSHNIWEYDYSTNLYRFVRGSGTPNGARHLEGEVPYVYHPLNNPKSRWLYGGWRVDDKPNPSFDGDGATVLIFGGDVGGGYHNDVWQLNFDNYTWRWLHGASGNDDFGVYDRERQGQWNESAMPAARREFATWTAKSVTDTHTRCFLYGGRSFDETYANDLWEFDYTTYEWRWLAGGEGYGSMKTLYGHLGLYSDENVLGARMRTQVWTDSTGKYLFMFGGYGTDKKWRIGYMGDVWAWSIDHENWMYISGSQKANDRNFARISTDEPPLYGCALTWTYHAAIETKFYYFNGYQYCPRVAGYLQSSWTIEWQRQCFGLYAYEADVCSGRGACVDTNLCDCVWPYESTQCESTKILCNGKSYDDVTVCDAAGTCVADENCHCIANFYGPFCQEKIPHLEITSSANGTFLVVTYVVKHSVIMETSFGRLLTGEFDCTEIFADASVARFGTDPVCHFGNTFDATSFLYARLGAGYTVQQHEKVRLTLLTSPVNRSLEFSIYGTQGDIRKEGLRIFGYVMLGLLPVWVIVAVVLVIVIVCVCCVCSGYNVRNLANLKTNLKAKNLKHIDLILLEQEAEMKSGVFTDLKIDRKLFEINFDEIELEKVVASGATATVYRTRFKDEIVAFKCFKTKDITSQAHYNEFEKEVNVLASVNHPGILKFFGCSLNPPHMGIVTEFCPNSDLRTYISNEDNERLRFRHKLTILRMVADAMAYLNSKDIIHRDLKGDNILLDADLMPKLIDFGLSRVVEGNTSQYLTKQTGTSQYMAPEVTLGSKYGNKCDVFSYGIVMFEVLTENFEPYGRNPEFNVELKVALNPDFRPQIDYDRYEKIGWYLELMADCWCVDQDERPFFAQIVEVIDCNIEDSCRVLEEEENERIRGIEHQRRLRLMMNAKQQDTFGAEDA